MTPTDDDVVTQPVIVQGVFRVAPADRDAYLAESIAAMQASRAEAGCLEYVFAADPVEPDRVVLTERWASAEALAEHLRLLGERRREAAEAGAAPTGVAVLSREIEVYQVASHQSLG